jgi:DNA-binding response OmpR family regulator
VQVLIVEDSPTTMLVALEALTSRYHEVRTAATGEEGLTLARDHRFDVVILDLGLPDIDGLDVCREIRTFSDVYIIILTGRTEESDRIGGLVNGADDYVVKPFSPVELTARVEAMMRRRRAEDRSDQIVDDVLEHGALRIDRSSRQVTVSGDAVKLTKIEFTILERLLDKGGAVATRQELAEACWGPYAEDGGHTMSVHIANLRKKIGCDGSQVTTVRGIGYRLGIETVDNPVPAG